MFPFIKTRYYLKDFLPENYIDIHNHLLPGIDDGAKTTQETTELIAAMKELNIHKGIATPHTFNSKWNNTSQTIKAAFGIATKEKANKEFLKNYASEYMLDSSLIAKMKEEELLCIHDNFLLLELPLLSSPFNLYEMLFEIKIKNYKIILAHPERYFYLHNSIAKYEKLKEFGIFFQLNLLSLTGYYGKIIQKKAVELLENDLYDFTGSDIHSKTEINQFKTVKLQIPNKKKMEHLLLNNSIFLK
ncbi:tyrosine-protein phosphatase [Flavobacterium quisquiliarum]|uniref:protein-tyrosine-phosphatase n=1 Tax=Flavobacterium quisquiliarum TaxID=1834436 RepID=A0ABV8WGN4_9FLAO|nr:CpsB/CapC family capsule biosynthesis tyrosine phosphatase [Flavobacterium quisquiliarum]MBW1656711.1 histidinol phosphatase [Flavobacterium quisquiliarum]NWL00336.1 histidinol phosphatase [Flavobacterium collinsii]